MPNNFGFEVQKSGQILIFVDSRGKEHVSNHDSINQDMKRVHDENKMEDLHKEFEKLKMDNEAIGTRATEFQKKIEELKRENELIRQENHELDTARKNEEHKSALLLREIEMLRRENATRKVVAKIEVPAPVKDWQVALLGEYLNKMKKDDV
jgi:predicted RNase H-like nuclease (RuvC/YqgF family)